MPSGSGVYAAVMATGKNSCGAGTGVAADVFPMLLSKEFGVPMRMLIIGRGGQLAEALQKRAGSRGIDADALGRDTLDLVDVEAIRGAVHGAHEAAPINCIVNAAAYTAVDRAEDEPDLAFKINAEAPRRLALAAAEIGIPIIHISTDYVFPGDKTGAYREDDPTGPRNAYGRSKLAGEQGVCSAGARHVVVRTSWVYAATGQNFLRTMLKFGAERDVLRVVADQHGCPTSAGDLAEAVLGIAKQICHSDGTNDLTGIYHFSNRGPTSWHGFAQKIIEHAAELQPHVSWARIEAIGTADYPTKAHRPSNSVLDCGKIERTFGLRSRHWQVALEDVMGCWSRLGTERGARG